MSKIIGRDVEFGVAIEGTRNTAEATAQKWVKNVTADIEPKQTKVQDDNKRGRLEKHDGGRVVQKWFGGTVEGVMHIDTVGYFLNQLYGDCDTTTITGEVKSNTFTLAQNIEHPTLTLFRKYGGVKQEKIAGASVLSMELSATVDDYLRMTAEVEGITTSADSSTPTYDTEYDFIGRDITIKLADTEVGLATATALNCKNVTITWEVENIRNHILGSYFAEANYNPDFSVSVNVTKDYEDTTFEELAGLDTYKYAQIHIEGEADLGGGNSPSLTLTLNRVQVADDWSTSGGADELKTEDFTLNAYYNETDSEQSKVVLVNKTDYTNGS